MTNTSEPPTVGEAGGVYSEGEIREALQYLTQGRTTFIVAHRVQSVMNADLILVLDEGRIVQRGTHQQLMAQEGIYRRIYEMQARIEVELEKEMARVGLQKAPEIPISRAVEGKVQLQ